MTSNQPWWLTLPVEEVAATILQCFSRRTHESERDATKAIVSWFRTGSYSAYRSNPSAVDIYKDPDYQAVAEAIQALEHAGLLIKTVTQNSTLIGLTRRGMHALQTNTVRQHLGLSDAPPADSN
jgi:hypothetical protein